MTREQACSKATETMLEYLCCAPEISKASAKSYGLIWRAIAGRWDHYSIDIDQWHLIVSDNGGYVVQAS